MGMEKMRFLYLSISADQASSLPRRHCCTSLVSVHAVRSSSLTEAFRCIFGLATIELTGISRMVFVRARLQRCRNRLEIRRLQPLRSVVSVAPAGPEPCEGRPVYPELRGAGSSLFSALAETPSETLTLKLSLIPPRFAASLHIAGNRASQVLANVQLLNIPQRVRIQ